MMQPNKRVIHHDCCGTCMYHCLDDDDNGDELWFCLEGLDEDGTRNNEYFHDDWDQLRLKFFMVCDSYAQPPKSLTKG